MSIEIRCPQCGRFMVEAEDFARSICSGCGSEITYRSREHRRKPLMVLTSSATFSEVSASA